MTVDVAQRQIINAKLNIYGQGDDDNVLNLMSAYYDGDEGVRSSSGSDFIEVSIGNSIGALCAPQSAGKSTHGQGGLYYRDTS